MECDDTSEKSSSSESRRPVRKRTVEGRHAFLAAAGSRKGLVDPDQLIMDIYESRRLSIRPPVDLDPLIERASAAMKDYGTIDISEMSEVAKLVDELRKSDRPRVLQHGGENVAILTPLTEPKDKHWKPAEEQIAAVRSAAGGWKDMDVDTLIEQIYRDRENSDRPPVEL
ncbi:hypothetical protein BH24CHL1_BH24CHL1_08860 [soil metagenome]